MLVTGSGPGPRTEVLPEALAFARQGLSVLIYDKRSVGYSLLQRSYSLLADDALGAVLALSRHPGVDSHKVGIWGFSEGGWVAPLAASRSKAVAFVVLVGGNALTPLRQQTWEATCALRRQNVSGSSVDQAEPNMFRLLGGVGMFPEANYDGETVLRHVRQPVLALWGDDDLRTPPGENPPLVARALQQGGNLHYTFRFFPDADHSLHLSSDGGVTRLPALAPEYPELVGSWSRAVTSGRLPHADASTAPQQACPALPTQDVSWWNAPRIQLYALALLLLAFATYPLTAIARWIRGGALQASGRVPARLLAGTGTVAALGSFVYLLFLLITSGTRAAPGPVALDRPVLWLLLQGLALVASGAAIGLTLTLYRCWKALARAERLRSTASCWPGGSCLYCGRSPGVCCCPDPAGPARTPPGRRCRR